jgi:hypothetical protein
MEIIVWPIVAAEIKENTELKSEGKSRVCVGKSRILEGKKGAKSQNPGE